MTLIAAVDMNWAIGLNNDTLISIPADRKHFKELTIGNIIIVGRKTLESFPDGKPLDGRINIVITGDEDYIADDAVIVHSPKEAVEKAEALSEETGMKVFVAGGGCIYNELVDYCDEAVITYIYHKFEETDTYCPNLDENDEWELERVIATHYYEDICFEYRLYKKNI